MIGPFTARDGENLALYEWPLDAWTDDAAQGGLAPRAMVLLLHGLGEHAGRHDKLACQLLDWGFAVRAYDQRGHGRSTGQAGVLPYETALLDDLAEVVDDTRQRSERLPRAGGITKPLPLILLAHSLGGLVASRFVALKMRPVDALVLSSPALDAGLTVFQKLLLALLRRLAPNLRVNNGLEPRYLSHDPQVVKAYRADRLVHQKISARLGQFMATAGPATVAAAAHWSTPTLLLYAGADRLVNPAGSRAFAKNAAASPAVKPGTLTSQCFDGLYHELFNELDAAPVLVSLKTWLDARF